MRITKENLTRYDQHFKSWQRRRLGYGKALENWHQTEEAGAVAFYPVGGSSLEGKVKFSFTETDPASSTKNPDNPSSISGVSNINFNVCEWNILEYEHFYERTGDFASTDNGDGSVTINGTSPNGGLFVYRDNAGIYVNLVNLGSPNYRTYLPAGTYKFGLLKESGTYTANNGHCYIRLNAISVSKIAIAEESGYNTVGIFDVANQKASYLSDSIDGVQFVVPEGGAYYSWCLCYGSTSSYTNCVMRPYLYKVGADTDGSPLVTRNTSSLPLGSTYYGGEIDLATGLMTVTWVAVELNGTETWDAISSYNSTTGIGLARCYPENIGLRKKAALDVTLNSACTHFSYLGNFGGTSISDGTVTTPRFFYTNGTDSVNGQARFAVPYSNVADFKAWLAAQKTAGTPVMLTYKVYEPLTIQLSPLALPALAQTSRHEPRLNTVYTDADSIQITYQKSPVRAATEQEMAILGLGGNV